MHETWEMLAQSLGWDDPLEEGMETHSSILAWRTPWTEEPGRLQSMGLQRIGYNWATEHTHTHTHTHTSGEKESLRKNQKELLEIRNTVNEMKNAFEELISGIGMIEERISEFEDISKETFKTEDNKK